MGMLIAVGFSFIAYRLARQTGRNTVLWIAMVWGLGTVFALLFGVLGGVVDMMIAKDDDVDAGNVEPYISFWASAAGTVIGAGIAALLAGRPLPTASGPPIIDAELVDTPPPA